MSAMYQPLADRLRPNSIDEVVGQRHILGEQGVLRRIIQGGNIPNLIFYGPSGTGKTTVAEIAAAQMHRPFHRLNATTASLADIKAITADVGTLLAPEGVAEHIARSCGGDVRKALNAVEALFAAHAMDRGETVLTLAEAQVVAQRSANRYDRDGDSHYDILSAFQKSVRGSDPDAAVHYLARLLEAGDLISPCRRLMVMASEDVGLAYPQAVAVVKACVDSANMLGLPEARIPLAQAAIFLATAPKSNSAILAVEGALADLRAGRTGEVPPHLRDAHYGGAAQLGHGTGYQYAHGYPNHYVKQQYLPDPLKNRTYYTYGENKTEQAAKQYWDRIKGEG